MCLEKEKEKKLQNVILSGRWLEVVLLILRYLKLTTLSLSSV